MRERKKKRVSRKKPETPRSRFVNALRMLWLRSRERAAVLKRDNNTCQCCHRKAFKITRNKQVVEEFKVQVHHIDGIDWSGLVDLIRERLLQKPERLVTLCADCHDRQDGHKNEDYWMT